MISLLFLFVFLTWYIKSIRFYIFSWFFVFLNDNEKIGKLLGIKYVNDNEISVFRKDTQMYFPGINVKLIEYFFLLNIVLDFTTHKNFVKLQFSMANNINFDNYFLNIKDKTMTLDEFEDYLSKMLLLEINSFIKVLTDEELIFFYNNNKIIRSLLNGILMTNGSYYYELIKNVRSLLAFRSILKKIPEEYRTFYIVPHLTMINKLMEMIVYKNGDFTDLQFYEFLISSSKFYNIIHKNDLYFIRRTIDKKNNHTNTGFGVKGHQCPAAFFVTNIFKKIINLFKNYKIEIIGQIKYDSQKRFLKNVVNKNEILLKFT